MANKMLIDASHPEETRVVVVRGQKVEEFDFESANRKQLRGNIYLAKVTRVEPSLQAAFVEYGGNRHGFLAFSEIHPDYYQIPVADRQALLEAEAEAQREEEHEEERRSRGRRRRSSQRRTENDETVVSTEAEAGTEDASETARSSDASDSPESVGDERETSASDAMEAVATVMAGDAAPGENAEEAAVEAVEASAHVETAHVETAQGDEAADAAEARSPEGDTEADEDEDEDEDEDDHDVEEHEIVEQLGGDDAIEDLPQRRRTPRKQYKIQEVIKRRQILLVQVVKEERAGAAASPARSPMRPTASA
jgi:ribonuclease E